MTPKRSQRRRERSDSSSAGEGFVARARAWLRAQVRSPDEPPRQVDAPDWLILGSLVGWCLLLFIPGVRILRDLPIYGDDHSSHMVAVQTLLAHIKAGNTDLWCQAYNLGFPMYLYYQPLPHLTAALMHLLTFGALSPQVAFNATVVLTWTFYPLTTYVGARRLGLDRTQSLVCALLAPLVSSELKFGFTIHSLMGLGLYTQHYAMLLFPLALGTLWQAVDGWGETAAQRRRRVIAAGGLLVLICISHAFYGVVLATSGVIMVLVRPREQFTRRTGRLLMVGLLTALSLLFWIIPLLQTHSYAGGWPWGGVDRWQGYGALRIAKTFAIGKLFDQGQLPALSIGILIGLAVCVRRFRKQPVMRALLICFALFVFFLMGRRTFGHLVDIQPINLGLQLFRYIGAVHAFGVILAGIGLCTVARWIGERLPQWSAAVFVAALIASPLVKELTTAGSFFRTVESYDLVRSADLAKIGKAIDTAVKSGKAKPGRIYAHGKAGTGSHLVAGLIGRYSEMPVGQSYGVGMHDSLGFYYLEYLYPHRLELLRFYNFRFVLTLPEKRVGGVLKRLGMKPMLRARRVLLYQLPGKHGYFTTGYTTFAVRGKPRDIRETVKRWLRYTSLPAAGVFGRVLHDDKTPTKRAADGSTLPVIELGKKPNSKADQLYRVAPGARTAVSAFPSGGTRGRPGEVLSERVEMTSYHARVRMNKRGTLVLKVNYHPYWRAVVDGRAQKPQMVTPSFLSLELAPGDHDVTFRFVRPTFVKLLWLATALMWLLLLVVPALLAWRAKRARAPRPRERRPDAKKA
ncbi:MAG: YfhO family protein [Myxococcales bacterium]|nr:YfhO family protein [Myxococcales bacterium]